MLARWLWLFGSFPHWGAVVFRTRSSVQCDPTVALLRGLLTSVLPAGSDLCPGKAISAFCHGWGCCVSHVKGDKLLRGSCVLIMNLSVSWSYKACLLFGCHGWQACVFQVNVLSATFVLLLACINVCTIHAQCRLTLLFCQHYSRCVHAVLLIFTVFNYILQCLSYQHCFISLAMFNAKVLIFCKVENALYQQNKPH